MATTSASICLDFTSDDSLNTELVVFQPEDDGDGASGSSPQTYCSVSTTRHKPRANKTTIIRDGDGEEMVTIRWRRFRRNRVVWPMSNPRSASLKIERPIGAWFGIVREEASFEGEDGGRYAWMRDKYGQDLLQLMPKRTKIDKADATCLGRVYERVGNRKRLEIYPEFSSDIEQLCVVSGIFALRYLERDLLAAARRDAAAGQSPGFSNFGRFQSPV